MTTKPIVNAKNLDGNIFAVVGATASALERAGQRDDAKAVRQRLTTMRSYHEALALCLEYVEFDFTGKVPATKPNRPAKEHEMPAGVYVISDPCYILKREIYDQLLEEDAFDDGKKHTFGDGKAIWILGTMHGDGEYDGFLVDSGTIACIEYAPEYFMEGFERSTKGKVYTAERPFECEADDEGLLIFGQLEQIMTGDTYCEECGDRHCDGECQYEDYDDEDEDEDY